MSIACREINLEPVARGEDGRLFDLASGANDVGLDVPFGFRDGEFFTNFNLCVVNGQADDMNLKAFGSKFETFLLLGVCV